MKHILLLCLFLDARFFFATPLKLPVSEKVDTATIQAVLNNQIVFTENKGQWEANILYRSTSPGFACQALKQAISFGYAAPATQEQLAQKKEWDDLSPDLKKETIPPTFNNGGFVWNLEFVNPSTNLQVGQENLREDVNHYYLGKETHWASNCKNSSRLIYKEVWNKTDILLYGADKNTLEYDVILHPGAVIEDVVFNLNGVLSARLNEAGQLEIQTGFGLIRKSIPSAWQLINGRKKVVQAAFILKGTNLSFTCPSYNPAYDLIIDPLVWSTWVSGAKENSYVYDMAVDEKGQVFITGFCNSNTFPTVPGSFNSTFNSNYRDAVLCKLKSDGSGVLFTAFIGGNDHEIGYSVFYEKPFVYVTGITQSYDFPLGKNCPDSSFNGVIDAFFVKISSDGSSLLQGSYLGGSGNDKAQKIFVKNEEIVVVGNTYSKDFPITSQSFNQTLNGISDMYVYKFNSRNNSLVFCNQLGGKSEENAYALFISDQKIYVGGYTASSDFTTTSNAFSQTMSGGSDAFILVLNSKGDKLLYSSYFGGSSTETIQSLYVEMDAVYATGGTNSTNFPLTAGVYGFSSYGSMDVFIFKYTIDNNKLQYSVLIGTTGIDNAYDIEVEKGIAFIVGITTRNNNSSLISISDTICDLDNLTGYDVFIIGLNENGSKLLYSTVFGGSSNDYTPTMGKNKCNLYTSLTSHSRDFPTTSSTFIKNKPNSYLDAMAVVCLDIRNMKIPEKMPRPLKERMNLCVSNGKLILNTGLSNTVWSNGVSDSVITVTKIGTYHAYIFYACDNVYHDSCIVDSAEIDLFLGHDTMFCRMPFSLKLETGLDSVFWSTGDTSTSITVDKSGWYWAKSRSTCASKHVDSIEVKYSHEDSLLAFVKDTLVCQGDTITLHSRTSNTFWSTGDTAASIKVFRPGIYLALAKNKCNEQFKDSFVYDTIIYTKTKLRNDTLICGHFDSLLLNCLSKNTLWSTGKQGDSVYIHRAGTYWAETSSVCQLVSRDSFKLELDTIEYNLQLPNDTSFCGNVSYQLNSPYSKTLWSDGHEGNNIQINNQGTYSASVENLCGDVFSDSIRITLIEIPFVHLPNDTTVCGRVQLVLNSLSKQAQWSDGSKGQYLIVNTPGIYTATYQNICGYSSDTVTISTDSTVAKLYIPSAFSPDGNSINEVFPMTDISVENFNLQVYNLWGELVYEGAQGWDGAYKGSVAQQGVYVWLIKYRDCNSKQHFDAGTVTLLR